MAVFHDPLLYGALFEGVEVGDTVRLVRPITVRHFKSQNMELIGVVTKIDHSNFVARKRRPYFVSFGDRAGEWSYGHREITLVKKAVKNEK